MFKKISSLLLTLLMIFSISTTVFAQDAVQVLNTSLPAVTNSGNSNNSIQRVPNAIPITVNSLQDGTGVDVYVGNIGVDGLDNVTVTVTATGYSQPKTKSGYVPAVIGKNFYFNFPYIKCNTTYDVSIEVVDGSGTRYLTGQAKLTYSETALQNSYWHKGTFSTRAASLEYHFRTHGTEVSATNLVEYLNYAMNYRSEILTDLQNGQVSKYTITTSPGATPAKKYKNKTDGRFAILSNSGNEILSFGK